MGRGGMRGMDRPYPEVKKERSLQILKFLPRCLHYSQAGLSSAGDRDGV